jgi:hypothetical protein
MNPVVFS